MRASVSSIFNDKDIDAENPGSAPAYGGICWSSGGKCSFKIISASAPGSGSLWLMMFNISCIKDLMGIEDWKGWLLPQIRFVTKAEVHAGIILA